MEHSCVFLVVNVELMAVYLSQHKMNGLDLDGQCILVEKYENIETGDIIPIPGIEPGPSGWEPGILTTRQNGMQLTAIGRQTTLLCMTSVASDKSFALIYEESMAFVMKQSAENLISLTRIRKWTVE